MFKIKLVISKLFRFLITWW